MARGGPDLMIHEDGQLDSATLSAVVRTLLVAFALIAGGCDKGATSDPPTTPTPAAPAYTETFAGTLPVGASRFYSFSIAVEGTINATLVDIGGSGVGPSTIVDLGIGSPAGVTCTAGRTPVQANGDAGIARMVSTVQTPGTYCVIISDAGNLAAPATFHVAIEHP
jgi:hypothetical protein